MLLFQALQTTLSKFTIKFKWNMEPATDDLKTG